MAEVTKTRDDLVEHVNSFARNLFEKDGEHAPMVLLFKDLQSIGICDIRELMKDNESKNQLVPIIRELIAKHGIDLVVFIAEAWAYQGEKLGKPDPIMAHVMAGEISVSELEPQHKREILMLNVEAKDGFQVRFIHPIIREGDSVTLGPSEKMDGGGEGRLGGFFADEPAVRAKRKKELMDKADEAAKQMFGRGVRESIEKRICVMCGEQQPAVFENSIDEEAYRAVASCPKCIAEMPTAGKVMERIKKAKGAYDVGNE